MVIAHAQIVEPHDVGMLDSLDDLVLLQKAPERIVELGALLMAIACHLERHQRSGLLAFGQIEVRNRAGGQSPDVAIAADEGVSEALLPPTVPG